jgi:subtilase family serine protease
MVYLQPSFQKGVVPDSLATYNPEMTGPGARARVVPDVAMLADPITGFNIGLSQDGKYSEFAIGGTSLASPLFVATVALAQQSARRTFGAANALLYRASKRGAFHDITPTRTLQAVALAPSGVLATFGYTGPENRLTSAKGYDDETGLGVPNGEAFIRALSRR